MNLNKSFITLSRAIVILFIGLLTLLSLDAFGEGGKWYLIIAGFLIHLIPALLLVTILILTWNKTLYAGISFFVLALIFTLFFKTYQEPLSLLTISGPLFIASVFFILSEYVTKPKKVKRTPSKKTSKKKTTKKTTKKRGN